MRKARARRRLCPWHPTFGYFLGPCRGHPPIVKRSHCMTEKTPYSRSLESNSRERKMRTQMVPSILTTLGELVSDRKVNGMQMVTVQPPSGPPLVVWVKCAWKPGTSGNCAVQMAFPSKEDRAHTAEEVVNVVEEKTKRAIDRGATHILFWLRTTRERASCCLYAPN